MSSVDTQEDKPSSLPVLHTRRLVKRPSLLHLPVLHSPGLAEQGIAAQNLESYEALWQKIEAFVFATVKSSQEPLTVFESSVSYFEKAHYVSNVIFKP